MAKEYFSLSRSKILNKARPYPKLRDMMVDILKNAPMKKAGFIADENWDGKKPCVIKVSDKNFTHIVKTLGEGKKSMSKGQVKAMTYELVSGKVSGGKAVPVNVRFRQSGKIAPTAAGTEQQEKGSAYILSLIHI